MRILWLKSDLLLPLDKGGKLRTWHLLRHLAARHEITYLAFADPDQVAADDWEPRPEILEGMGEVAAHVETVPKRDPPKGSLRFYTDAARFLADPLPYAVAKYRSRTFATRLRELLASGRFDVLVCDFIFPAVNLPRSLPCPAVLFTHNIESEIWRRHAETRRGFSRLLYRIQHRRMLRFEGSALARFDSVLAVSEADRDGLARIYPGAMRRPARVIPTGVDVSYFTPAPASDSSRHLVFTGSMDWLPNEDAMAFFCRDVLPRIRAQEPGTTLSIVGRAPTPAVRRLSDIDGVTVTGRVEDVRPFIAESAVYVVPLRIGGGTRLKIFEAMAMGKAIVSTTVGAEGLPVSHGEQLMIADDPERFARSVIMLMRNPGRRQALEAAARDLVVRQYDWSAVAGTLESALQRVLPSSGQRSADGASAENHVAASSTPA